MGALYLAAELLKIGIQTHIIGSNATPKELDELIGRVDPVAVGCSVMTGPEIVDFARLSLHVQRTHNTRKRVLPVIWGGMHPTIVTEQTLREEYIDIVVSGEAEITLPSLLFQLSEGKFPEHKLVQSRTPSQMDELRPLWEAVDLARFVFPESHSVHADVEFKRQNVFYYLLTSRGCTYQCNFCWEVARTIALKAESLRLNAGSSGKDLAWRAHSFEWMAKQVEYVESTLRRKGIVMDGVGIWDDMFFGRSRPEDIKRARRTFSMMCESNFGYLMEVRANQLIRTDSRWNDAGVAREADLYRYLKETGCMQVFVGTESANQDTLNLIQKGTRATDYLRLVEISRDIGLPLRFSMIVGFPKETERSINDTLDFIGQLGSEPYISVSGPKLFTPYPATKQFEMAVAAGFQPPQTTVEWGWLNRYGGKYRDNFPWLRRIPGRTLDRIEGFFSKISQEKRRQPDEEAINEVILETVRGH